MMRCMDRCRVHEPSRQTSCTASVGWIGKECWLGKWVRRCDEAWEPSTGVAKIEMRRRLALPNK